MIYTLDIIFENEDFLAINKPAFLAVHADGKRNQETLVDILLEKYAQIEDVGEDIVLENGDRIKKSGIVHRLDKDTSGVMLVAKNQKSYLYLKSLFQEKKVKKEYLAIVQGWVREDFGIIDKAIGRSKNDFRKKVTSSLSSQGQNFRGEERLAQTRFAVEKRFKIFGQKLSLVRFFPLTGRMHQIRVHSQSIGHPIVGDSLYGVRNLELEKVVFEKYPKRQLLHARKISFADNSFEASIPQDMENALSLAEEGFL